MIGRNSGKTTRKILAAITCIMRNKQNAVFISRNSNSAEDAQKRMGGVLDALRVPFVNAEGGLIVVTNLQDRVPYHVRFIGERDWLRDCDIIREREPKAHYITDLDSLKD